jgi:hypothetical protein
MPKISAVFKETERLAAHSLLHFVRIRSAGGYFCNEEYVQSRVADSGKSTRIVRKVQNFEPIWRSPRAAANSTWSPVNNLQRLDIAQQNNHISRK